jgi:hypothetical protein
MPYNPCGRAVDMARRPYTTLVRPFRDSDRTVRIRWYPARPETDGTLPFPSRICSLDWATNPHAVEGVGEVYDAPRRYNGARALVGPPTRRVCGTEDQFRNGAYFDDDRAPTEYFPNGLPKCCGLDGRGAEAPVSVNAVSLVRTERRHYATPTVSVNAVSLPSTGGSPSPVVRTPNVSVNAVSPTHPPISEPRISVNAVSQYTPGDLGGDGFDYENPCAVSRLPLDVWIGGSLQTPHRFGLRWDVPPGFYCLTIRGTFFAASGDVEAYAGPLCDQLDPIPVATTNSFGQHWDVYGQDPPENPRPDRFYYQKEFNFLVTTTLFVIFTPDDITNVFHARLAHGVCTLPVP